MATDELSAKQHKAISALLAEPTIKKAAESVGIGERTLHTWLAEAPFDAAYRHARRRAVQQATARLQQASAAAVHVLLKIMAEPMTPAAVKLAAASKILDMAVKSIELDDLDQRIAALEAAQDAHQEANKK